MMSMLKVNIRLPSKQYKEIVTSTNSSGGVRRALTSGLAARLTPTLPRLATLAPAWVLHLNWVPRLTLLM